MSLSFQVHDDNRQEDPDFEHQPSGAVAVFGVAALTLFIVVLMVLAIWPVLMWGER